MCYGHEGRQPRSVIQDVSDPGRVHTGLLWQVTEHVVTNVFHVLWYIAEVEVFIEGCYNARVVQLIFIVIRDSALGGK